MVGRILYITVKQDTRKEFLWKKKSSVYRKQTCYRKDFLQNRQDFALLEENLFVKFSRNREEHVAV